jgi:hypothetical protein
MEFPFKFVSCRGMGRKGVSKYDTKDISTAESGREKVLYQLERRIWPGRWRILRCYAGYMKSGLGGKF